MTIKVHWSCLNFNDILRHVISATINVLRLGNIDVMPPANSEISYEPAHPRSMAMVFSVYFLLEILRLQTTKTRVKLCVQCRLVYVSMLEYNRSSHDTVYQIIFIGQSLMTFSFICFSFNSLTSEAMASLLCMSLLVSIFLTSAVSSPPPLAKHRLTEDPEVHMNTVGKINFSRNMIKPTFCTPDMSRYGYLEAFQGVPWTSR